MNKNYIKNIKLRCITCGDDSSFDYNENKTYIKCLRCNREYFGGYEELVALNQALIDRSVDDLKEQIQTELSLKIKSMFNNL